jgi:hypothetical protein
LFRAKRNKTLTAVQSGKEKKMSIHVEQWRRADRLHQDILDMCFRGVRNPEDYLDILQAINDGCRVEVVTSPVFLSPIKQFEGFRVYNEWLRENHPEYVISKEEIAEMEAKLPELPAEVLIFYCHRGEVVLTAGFAWQYISSYREKTWKADYVRFEAGYMKPAEREPDRPEGFYVMRRPAEDGDALGKRFQGIAVSKVQRKLGNDWGMSCEGFQFMGITHKHYPELMDGDKFPFIDLPGLAVAPGAVGDFCLAPYLHFFEGGLRLGCGHVDDPISYYGSGCLQQC